MHGEEVIDQAGGEDHDARRDDDDYDREGSQEDRRQPTGHNPLNRVHSDRRVLRA